MEGNTVIWYAFVELHSGSGPVLTSSLRGIVSENIGAPRSWYLLSSEENVVGCRLEWRDKCGAAEEASGLAGRDTPAIMSLMLAVASILRTNGITKSMDVTIKNIT